MKIKFIPAVVYFLISFSFCFSQNPDIKRTYNWYFGEYAGLDFSSGNPAAVTNSAMYDDGPGTSSISDTSGNLLFYTDGKSVWNKNHQLMPNGTGLHAGAGSVSSVIIIPKPMSNNIYYIFHCWINPDSTTFKYTIVDMSLQGGLGDVSAKNIVVLSSNNGVWTWGDKQLAATKHKNDTDIWVMIVEVYTNNYYALRITPTGLNPVPVISSAGKPDMYGNNTVKFAPSGKKMAIGFNNGDGFEILNFDNATGIVSNPIIFPGTAQFFGLEFSPDESKLYITENKPSPLQTRKLYQVDLSSGDSITIVNSLTLITSTVNSTFIGFVQQASDGKLYVAKPYGPDIGVITNPNAPGILCNYIDNGVNLAGKNSGMGLPSFISSYFYDSSLVTVTPIPELHDGIVCYPNPFNYTTTIIIPSSLTISEVTLIDLLGRKTDIKKKITKENDKTIITLERNNLPAGIYFLNIKTNNNIYSQKLIITN